MRDRRALRVLNTALVLASAGSLVGVGVLAQSAPRDLDATCRALRDGENPYFGRGLTRSLALQVASARSGSERSELAGYLGLLGAQFLRHGETVQAIAHLEEAQRVLSSLGEPDENLDSTLRWHLGLAHLQKGEDENCVGHRSADSCIVPLRPGAIHEKAASVRAAARVFRSYAEDHPRNIQAAWLLNLATRLAGDDPTALPRALRLPDSALEGASLERWVDVAPQLGINHLDLAGGGVMDDFDGDGFLDVISSTWDPCGSLKAFRNDGAGGFEDVTEAWKLEGQLGGLNLLHADYDNDGRLDLLVLRGAWLLDQGRIRNSLLQNRSGADGAPVFVDVTHDAGLAEPAYPTQAAAFADFDLDGDLDLFVGNESSPRLRSPSQLFRNRGDGTFEEIAAAAGVENLRYTKGAAWGDADLDGDPDLYVSNFGENRLYRNDGDGSFTDIARSAGVVEPRRESFATWFFDFDQDGDLDLYVGDYREQAPQVTASYFGLAIPEGQPLLYRNVTTAEGPIRFEEVSRSVGITRPAMPMGANYGDLDNDGFLDFYLGTGEPDLASLMPNVMYRNTGGRFEEVTFSGGFGHLQKGHGVAFGDIDNDGDQDLFHQLGGFYPGDTFGNALFLNPGNDRHWLQLSFVGKSANRFGVGARVELTCAASTRSYWVGTGGSFGGNSHRLELGLGDAETCDELVVSWPGGARDVFEAVLGDRAYVVVEGAEALTLLSLPPVRLD